MLHCTMLLYHNVLKQSSCQTATAHCRFIWCYLSAWQCPKSSSFSSRHCGVLCVPFLCSRSDIDHNAFPSIRDIKQFLTGKQILFLESMNKKKIIYTFPFAFPTGRNPQGGSGSYNSAFPVLFVLFIMG